MTNQQLEQKMKSMTMEFAIATVLFVKNMPRNFVADHFCRQLLRSATSVGANYRSACRSRSKADMVSRLAIVEEEADESIYWLDLLVASDEAKSADVRHLVAKADEVLRIVVSSLKTLKHASGLAVREPRSSYGGREINDDDESLDDLVMALHQAFGPPMNPGGLNAEVGLPLSPNAKLQTPN